MMKMYLDLMQVESRAVVTVGKRTEREWVMSSQTQAAEMHCSFLRHTHYIFIKNERKGFILFLRKARLWWEVLGYLALLLSQEHEQELD